MLDAPTGTLRVVVEFALHALVALVGLGLYFGATEVALQFLGGALVAAGSIGVGANTHNAAHFATSKHRWLNDALRYFGHPFFVGLSSEAWRHSHNAHHRAPNVVGLDPDVDQWPLFSIFSPTPQPVTGWRRVYYERVQGFVAPFAVALTFVGMNVDGALFVLRGLQADLRSRLLWLDVVALGAHALFWIAAPVLLFGVESTALLYGVRLIALGYAAFGLIGPGHLPVHIPMVEGPPCADPLLRCSATTTNYRTGTIGNIFAAGLGDHIEHHLFPHLNHPQLRYIRPIVERHCRTHGYPYRVDSWWRCVRRAFETFAQPKTVQTQLTKSVR